MSDKIEQIRALRDQGQTLRQIGETLGCSTGSVSGLMARNRDLFPITDLRMSDLRKTKNRPKSNKLRQIFHEALQPHPVPKPKQNAAKYDKSREGIPLHELGKHECHWPLNEGGPFLFCGEVKAGKNYCENHAQRSVRML